MISWDIRKQMEAIVDPFILLSKNRITRHRFAMTANVMDSPSPTLRIVGFDLYSMTCVPAVLTYHYRLLHEPLYAFGSEFTYVFLY
jgi:hypothetical protein